MLIHSPAKVNLALDVLEKRSDGFHGIHTVFYEIDLADELEMSLTPAPEVSLHVVEGNAPEGEGNLAHRAARMVLERSGRREGIYIRLAKRIPAQGGLGGGSSNAAAALKGAAALLGLREDLRPLAEELGSDVPFFLEGGTAHGRGRGEILEQVRHPLQFHLLLVKPDTGVSTPWAYAELDKTGLAGTEGFAARMVDALRSGDRERALRSMGNDFELVVFQKHPEIGRLKNRLEAAGAEVSLLSGSGATVFGVFPTRQECEHAAELFGDVWHAAVSGMAQGGAL